MSYLLLIEYGSEGWGIKRAETLEELAALYREYSTWSCELICAKEMKLKLIDPDELKEVEL